MSTAILATIEVIAGKMVSFPLSQFVCSIGELVNHVRIIVVLRLGDILWTIGNTLK